jgi:hypothetical protein
VKAHSVVVSRLPHFLDNRLIDGGELSVTRAGRPLPPGRFRVLISGRIRSIEKSNDLIGNRTLDLPACSIVPRPTTLPRALALIFRIWISAILKDLYGGAFTIRMPKHVILHNL